MQRIIDAINNLPPTITSAIMAVIVAILRVVYDREETKPIRVMMEACICGLLSVATCHAIKALGVDANWGMFFSALIGYIGSNKVRVFAIKFIERKAK